MKKIVALLLALTLLFTFSVTAFAAKSPEASKVHKVTVVDGKEGVISTSNHDGDETITLEADEKNGKFDEWIIYKKDAKTHAVEDVDYVIVDGSLKDKVLVITALADLIVCANYDGKITDATIALKGDGSNKAPQTSDALAGALVLVMAAAATCGFAAKKRLG